MGSTRTLFVMSANLRDRLETIQVENYESKWYIPHARLEALLTETVLKDTIISCGIQPYKWQEVQHAVAFGGRRVFAVLIMIGKESEIVRFIENDHMQGQPLDARLPFSKTEVAAVLGEPIGELFYRKQWVVSVPQFRADMSHRIFGRGTILPFDKNRTIGSGAFGTVYEVKLNAEHHSALFPSFLPTVIIS